MKKSLVIVIVILILVIVGLCAFIAYDKNLLGIKGESKTEKNNVEKTKEEKKNNNDDIKSNETAYVIDTYNKRVSWPFPESFSPNESEKTIDIVYQAVLPKITINTDTTKKLNSKIMDDYKAITDTIDSGTYSSDKASVTACHVDYDYSVNDNIIFILITSACGNYRGSGRTTHVGYYYDIKNDKELSVQDIFDKYGITIANVNEKITNENNVRGENSKVVLVDNMNQIPAVMTIANVKSFDVYVETSMEPYVAYIYKP